MAAVADKWGNRWNLAQRTRDMTRAEMDRAGKEFAAKMEAGKKK